MGTTVRRSFIWYPPESVVLGADGVVTQVVGSPYDLTDAVARMQIRKRPGAPVIATLTSAPDGGITLGGSSGDVDFELTASETEGWPVRGSLYSLAYDLEVTLADGTVHRVVEGAVIVSPDVTRPADPTA